MRNGVLKIIQDLILKRRDTEAIFNDMFKKWKICDYKSISGPGSTLDQTEVIRRRLPLMFEKFNISTLLDIPCGDFYWMSQVDLDHVNYTGGDIVKRFVEHNNNQYRNENRRFIHVNLIEDDLPEADMLLCRDCLVHLSASDIFKALHQICRSNSKFLLTTTFTGIEENIGINTGEWRPINLTVEPFCFPEPKEIIVENCTENDGKYSDKSLGLWEVKDIAACL